MTGKFVPVWVLLPAGVCFFGIPAHSELVWERTVYEAKAKEGAKEERAVYRFQNKGDHPVMIGKVKASCGCTTVELAKKHYEPGERGEVTAVFTFGKRKGMQEKSIRIETDDILHPTEVLLFRVELPDVIDVRKKELSWGVGDPLEEQSVELVLKDSIDLTIKGLNASDGFEAQLQEVRPKKIYRVLAKPLSTDAPRIGRIAVTVNESNGTNRTLNLKVSVR